MEPVSTGRATGRFSQWRRSPIFAGKAPINVDAAAATATRLVVRRPNRSDINAIVEIASQPSSMAANGWTDETAASYAERLRSQFRSEAKCRLVGALASGEVVGTELSTREAVPDALHIGMLIADAHVGKGYGTELLRAMIIGCQDGKVTPALWVGTGVDNIGVQRVLERLGYRALPSPRPFPVPDGRVLDSYWYQVGLTRPAPEQSPIVDT